MFTFFYIRLSNLIFLLSRYYKKKQVLTYIQTDILYLFLETFPNELFDWTRITSITSIIIIIRTLYCTGFASFFVEFAQNQIKSHTRASTLFSVREIKVYSWTKQTEISSSIYLVSVKSEVYFRWWWTEAQQFYFTTNMVVYLFF